MSRKRNDATLSKLGDIYQYFIALMDCFKMETGDKIQIEFQGGALFEIYQANRKAVLL